MGGRTRGAIKAQGGSLSLSEGSRKYLVQVADRKIQSFSLRMVLCDGYNEGEREREGKVRSRSQETTDAPSDSRRSTTAATGVPLPTSGHVTYPISLSLSCYVYESIFIGPSHV